MKTIKTTLGVLSALVALLMIPQEGLTAGMSQIDVRDLSSSQQISVSSGIMKLADDSAKVPLDRSALECVETRCFWLRGEPICFCDRITEETEEAESPDPAESDPGFACPTVTSTSGDVTDGVVTHTFTASEGRWAEGHVYEGGTALGTFSPEELSIIVTVAVAPDQSSVFEFRFSGFGEAEYSCGSYSYTAPANVPSDTALVPTQDVSSDPTSDPASDPASDSIPDATSETTGTEMQPTDSNIVAPEETPAGSGDDEPLSVVTPPAETVAPVDAAIPPLAPEEPGQVLVGDVFAAQPLPSDIQQDSYYAQGGAAGCSLILQD